MHRAVYVLPELVLIGITEFAFILATGVLIINYLYGILLGSDDDDHTTLYRQVHSKHATNDEDFGAQEGKHL